MVIDSSALLAILQGEPESSEFIQKVSADSICLLSAATYVEASIVLMGRLSDRGDAILQELLQRSRIEIVPLDEAQALLAREGFRKYGKGRHPAGLNFGDCFSYALAKQTGEPLLYKGSDFSLTDIASA